MGWEGYESRISLTKGPAIRSCEYHVVGTAFSGGPHGATTTLARGAPKWGGATMRTLPLEPSVELPMGPRTV